MCIYVCVYDQRESEICPTVIKTIKEVFGIKEVLRIREFCGIFSEKFKL